MKNHLLEVLSRVENGTTTVDDAKFLCDNFDGLTMELGKSLSLVGVFAKLLEIWSYVAEKGDAEDIAAVSSITKALLTDEKVADVLGYVVALYGSKTTLH